MKIMKRLLVALVLLMVLMGSKASAATWYQFADLGNTDSDWRSSSTTTAVGSTWEVDMWSVTNHGVGRVFTSGSFNWGSGLYTYNTNTLGFRGARNYTSYAPSGTSIVWRMRGDNSYSSLFSCYGYFYE